MLNAKELLIIKARLEAAVAVLSETLDREVQSRALCCLKLPVSLAAEEAEQQLHATELLLDIKKPPLSAHRMTSSARRLHS